MRIQAHSGKARSPWWVVLPVIAGFMLHGYEAFVASSGDNKGFAVGLFLWSALPFAVAVVLFKLGVRALRAAGYAWASLLGSLYMHYAVFVEPTGSTAALGLLFMPLWNLILLGPAGLLVAWGLQASAPGSGTNAA